MKTVAFGGQMGASGDMVLGALLAAGANPDVLEPIEAVLDIDIDVGERITHGLSVTDVIVETSHAHHRSFEEVIEIVEGMDVPGPVRQQARAAFELLGEAEAAVHGSSLEEIHFHEVGADDAIADIMGAAALLADLAPDRVVTAPLSVGAGEVQTSHGTYPIPPPAVVEIAGRASLSLVGGPVDAELLTPTGAAILGAMADPVETLPSMRISTTGYGCGTREFADRPNVLRAIVGDAAGALVREDVRVLETHIDDATPEVLGSLHDRLGSAGALDVAVVPVTMKKSRPGHLVNVVVRPDDAERLAHLLAVETGTLGIRSSGAMHRWVALRSIETVTITVAGETFDIDVKVATDRNGTVLDRSAEYDDAAAVAATVDLPVREIMRLAEAAAERD